MSLFEEITTVIRVCRICGYTHITKTKKEFDNKNDVGAIELTLVVASRIKGNEPFEESSTGPEPGIVIICPNCGGLGNKEK